MPQIVTIGEILVEIMTKETDQTFLSSGELLGPYPSGAPAIFADSAAKMGGDVGIISAVGKDDFGLLNLTRLIDDNVDVSRVKILPDKTTGTAFVTYFTSKERQFIFHFRDSAAGNITFTKQDEEYLKDCKYLHIMGCSVAASKMNTEAITAAVNMAKSVGAVISLDPNIRTELLSDKAVMESFNDILYSSQILLTGKKELLDITCEKDIKSALGNLFSKNMKIIVVKNGRHNVELYTKDEYFFCETHDYGEFVDATGAGDCFDGAFIAAISRGYSLDKALLLATTAGSVSVTKKGPMEGTSKIEDIKALIKKHLSLEI